MPTGQQAAGSRQHMWSVECGVCSVQRTAIPCGPGAWGLLASCSCAPSAYTARSRQQQLSPFTASTVKQSNVTGITDTPANRTTVNCGPEGRRGDNKDSTRSVFSFHCPRHLIQNAKTNEGALLLEGPICLRLHRRPID